VLCVIEGYREVSNVRKFTLDGELWHNGNRFTRSCVAWCLAFRCSSKPHLISHSVGSSVEGSVVVQ
jgi:hypothetical protein